MGRRTRRGEASLTSAKEPPAWLGDGPDGAELDWNGDGTVPAVSAYPIETDRLRGSWIRSDRRHLELGSAADAVEKLRQYEGVSTARFQDGARGRGPSIGIDLEEVSVPAQPLTVELHGVDPTDHDQVRMWLTLRSAELPEKRIGPTELGRQGDRWVGHLPVERSGLVTVTVQATWAGLGHTFPRG